MGGDVSGWEKEEERRGKCDGIVVCIFASFVGDGPRLVDRKNQHTGGGGGVRFNR